MRYILCVNDPAELRNVIAKYNVSLVTAYDNLTNMAAIDTDQTTAQTIQADSSVKYVRPDRANIRKFPARRTKRWNQAAICRTSAYTGPLGKFQHSNSTCDGTGVDAYVMDSGIAYEHVDFEGRAMPLPGWDDPWSKNGVDEDGHGTHVAGLIGGRYSGVAPGCRIFSVRVFGPGATDAATPEQFLGAVNTIIAHHITKNGLRPSIVNMSLGAGPDYTDPFVYKNDPLVDGDDYLDDAVAHLVAAGIQVCVAAGNGLEDSVTGNWFGRMNAFFFRPARQADVITVGAVEFNWNVDYYSNYGDCVDIYAPGTDLLSADFENLAGFVLMTGTSMATPVTTGVCALFLSKNLNATPMEVKDWLIKNAVDNQLANTAFLEEDDWILNGGAAAAGYALKYVDIADVETPLFYPKTPASFNRMLHNPYLDNRSTVNQSATGARVKGATVGSSAFRIPGVTA